MLEAEISHIFGLIFMAFLDFWSIFALLTAGITVLFLILQNRQQAKIASADLSLRMIDTVRKEDFREILGKIRDGKSSELDDNQIYKVLNPYEYLAEFEKDGLLDFDHVLHQHGRNIKMLYDDKRVKSMFDQSRQDNPTYNYTNLDNLFVKINYSID